MPQDVTIYDDKSPEDATALAWSVAGSFPTFHAAMKADVTRRWPILARAIERLVKQQQAEWRAQRKAKQQQELARKQSLDALRVVEDVSETDPARQFGP